MELTLGQMVNLLGVSLPNRRIASRKVTLCTDSRSFKRGQVFWAIKGEHFDGHDFVLEALNQGGLAAVVNQEWMTMQESIKTDKAIKVLIPVGDTRKALLTLAKGYAARYRIPKIGITGSNGKTTTKEMISAVLRTQGAVHATEGNFNNEIGVPLTLFGLKSNHRFAVIEMGMSHPGEIKPLSEATQPTLAVVTNIGDAHFEAFGSREKIRDEKLTITAGFKDRGVLVLNVDDPLLAEVRASSRQRLLTFGIQRGQIRPHELRFDALGCAHFKVGRTEFHLKVPGQHMVYNALAAIAVGTHLRIPKSAMAEALSKFGGAKNRMQVKSVGGVTLIDDCYNANPGSTRAALSTLGSMVESTRRVAILGDMLELGESAAAMHHEVGNYLVEMGVDLLFTFGSLSRHINQGAREKGMLPKNAQHFTDFDLLAQELLKQLHSGDVVLVKASRGMKLERVYEMLKANFSKTISGTRESR